MPAPPPDEQWVLDLWQWIGRALQYSVAHPVSMVLGKKAHERLSQALSTEGTIALGVFKDSLTLGTTLAVNPALRTRMAPYFHERGVVLVRFVRSVTLEELTSFVTVATMPTADVFAQGGMRALVTQRGVVRVQVEEMAGDILEQEREEDRRIKRLRELFLALLQGTEGERAQVDVVDMVALLDEPKMLARMLEQADPPKALAQILVGFADMVLEIERDQGPAVAPKLRTVLDALAPEARDRLILGFAGLDPGARQPLSEIFAGYDAQQIARLCFPSVRYHAQRLDRFYFAMRAVVPDAGKRIEVLRKTARLLHDLPLDEPATFDVMTALAEPPREGDAFRFERAILTKIAARIHDERAPFRERPQAVAIGTEAFEGPKLDALDHRVALEIALLGAKIVDFSDFAGRIPPLCDLLTTTGRVSGTTGLVRALTQVDDPRWRPVTHRALRQIASSDATAKIVRQLDKYEDRIDEIAPLLRVMASVRPDELFLLLEKSASRKLRRMVIDALASVGPAILPNVRQRIGAPEWFVVRNMVTLLGRLGGTAQDLAPLARHPQSKVRLEVARIVRGMTQDPGAAELLATLLWDSADDVQAAALAGLSDLPLDTAAIGAIEQTVLDERRSNETRSRALEALARSSSDEAAASLFRLIEPKGLIERPFLTTLREWAAVALYRSRAPSAKALFQRGMQSTTWRVRKACERAVEVKDA